MRKCSRCGNKIHEGERYCTACGAPYWMSKPSFWSTFGGRFLISALCLVMVAGLVLGAWLLIKSSDDGPSKAAESSESTRQSSEAAQTLPERTSEKETEQTEASKENVPETEDTQPAEETEEASSEKRSDGPAVNTETAPGPQLETTTEQETLPTEPETTVDGKALIRGVIGAKDSADIKWIINRFREVADHLDNFDSEPMEDGTRYYEKGSGELVCVQLYRNGTYEEYYYDNGHLFFADYYYDKTTLKGLTRFYYKDDMIIRYSERDKGPIHDYPDGLDPELFHMYSGERDLFTSGNQEFSAAWGQ